MRLGGSEIKDTFTGSLLALDTPVGTTIPIRFTGDGLMSGQAGSLASVLGAAQDRGRWWVTGDRLCYKWFRWFEAQSQCLTIRVKDERVFWRQDDGKRGTATIVERAPPSVAVAMRSPVRPSDGVTAELPAKALVTGPVLKSPPRLAVRPQTQTEDLAAVSGELSDRGLLFVGLGLSRALQSQLRLAEAAAAVPDLVPVPLKTKPQTAARVTPRPDQKAVAEPNAPRPDAQPTTGAVPARSSRVPAAAALHPPSFNVFGVDDGDVLNMRSGPSEEHPIVGMIPPDGSGVRLLGPCVDLWCQIQFGDARGWVNRYYLAENTAP